MADKQTSQTNGGTVPPDAQDFSSLFLDPALGDGIADTHYYSIPVGKPRDFFRTHPDAAYRRRAEIYLHKPENAIDEQHYIVDAPMQGCIAEARLCTLVTVIYRDGSPRIWPIKFPRDGERDNDAWATARAAAREGLMNWTKLVWVRHAYQTRDAKPGYAPEPDWTKLPSYDELIKLAFGEHGIIRDTEHPIYRELFGLPASPSPGNGNGGDL